jgi:hypothetical protein
VWELDDNVVDLTRGQFETSHGGEGLPLVADNWGLLKTELSEKTGCVPYCEMCETSTAIELVIYMSRERSINVTTHPDSVYSV